MTNEDPLVSLQIGAAVVTWVLVTGFVLYLAHINAALGVQVPAFSALAVINLVTTLLACLDRHIRLRRRQALHALGGAAVLAAGWVAPVSFMPIYTIVWLAVACSLYPPRVLWWLLFGMVGAWYGVMRLAWEDSVTSALISAVLYGTFHLFALLTSRSAEEASRARDEAQFLNRELLATQHLLSEASRQSERTRIARDLHDLLGHHLTALSINLQIAERLADGPAADKIAESRALARLLLSDVREAVSTLRGNSRVDFDQAIRLLVDQVPQLAIDLDIAPDLAIDRVEVAEALLRCVQEALTNTLRHAQAKQSWIRLWRGGDALHLEIRDDGLCPGRVVEGHGLQGMRERLHRLGGELQIDLSGQALRLQARIPTAEPAA